MQIKLVDPLALLVTLSNMPHHQGPQLALHVKVQLPLANTEQDAVGLALVLLKLVQINHRRQ
jgi:hypothetical protein